MNDWIRVVTLLPTCCVNLYRFLCLSVPFLCLNSLLIKWGSKIPAEKILVYIEQGPHYASLWQ